MMFPVHIPSHPPTIEAVTAQRLRQLRRTSEKELDPSSGRSSFDRKSEGSFSLPRTVAPLVPRESRTTPLDLRCQRDLG
jgi:hypothetical protein